MKVYKVCRVDHEGRFFSFDPLIDFRYRLGEDAKRWEGWGPMAAFDGLPNLRIFILACGSEAREYAVFEGKAGKSDDFEIWSPVPQKRYSNLPEGTVLCNWIRLERELCRGNKKALVDAIREMPT